MKNLAIKRIQQMLPYSPPLDGRSNYNGLLLDFNERTLPPSPNVIRALEQFVSGQKIQVYPEYFDLPEKIAAYVGVADGQIMVTNGTDQAIDVIFRTFADKGDKVTIPSPTFAMYEQYAKLMGANIISPLYSGEELRFPLKEVLDSIDQRTKIVVVCNPNSPTGTMTSLDAVEQIAKNAKDAIIYIDEAYFEFSKLTAKDLIKKYPNIIISRTFSKAFGLASLRIGYVIARPEYIKEMLKVRGPYDVNQAAYFAASASLDNMEQVDEYVTEVMQESKPFIEQFFKANGIRFYSSRGNFILFKPKNAAGVSKALSRKGILVRPQNKAGIEGTLRLTIGTMSQMKKFVKIYQEMTLSQNGQKYAILDRDGTLIFEPQDDFQVDSLAKLKILDGVIDGLQQLIKKGFKLVLVSNQNGIGSPSFPTESFEIPQARMMEIFKNAGIEFDEVFVCPHFAKDNCNCRKPKTGLLDEFLRTTEIDMENSFVCGDRATDNQLSEAIGLRYIPMALNGNFMDAIKPVIKE